MPNFRYTHSELHDNTDTWLLCKVLTERMSTCAPHSPLYKRLQAIKDTLRLGHLPSYNTEDIHA